MSRCITYDGEAGQLRAGMDMIEMKYRWQENKEATSENKDETLPSSMLWIKVLCDRQAKDHDEILK